MGRTHSPETRAKISAAQKRSQAEKPRTHSPETKAKMRAVKKANGLSLEQQEKMHLSALASVRRKMAARQMGEG